MLLFYVDWCMVGAQYSEKEAFVITVFCVSFCCAVIVTHHMLKHQPPHTNTSATIENHHPPC